jgi:hypothetical protein
LFFDAGRTHARCDGSLRVMFVSPYMTFTAHALWLRRSSLKQLSTMPASNAGSATSHSKTIAIGVIDGGTVASQWSSRRIGACAASE